MNNKVIIHCKNSIYEFITNSNLDYKDQGDELDVIVNNIDHLDDEQFCEHYGIDYDLVNCIEAM